LYSDETVNGSELLGFAASSEQSECFPQLAAPPKGYNSAPSCAALTMGYCDIVLSCAALTKGYCNIVLSCAALNKGYCNIALSCAALTMCYCNIALLYVVLKKDYCCSETDMFSASISTVFVVNAVSSFIDVLKFFIIQISNIITHVFHSVSVLVYMLKIIVINYGMWASITTHWLWDFINTFPCFNKSSGSEAYATAITLHQNSMLKHDYAVYANKTLPYPFYFSAVCILCLLFVWVKAILYTKKCYMFMISTLLASVAILSKKSEINLVQPDPTDETFLVGGGHIMARFSIKDLVPYVLYDTAKHTTSISKF
jgi:hypothetical protein